MSLGGAKSLQFGNQAVQLLHIGTAGLDQHGMGAGHVITGGDLRDLCRKGRKLFLLLRRQHQMDKGLDLLADGLG